MEANVTPAESAPQALLTLGGSDQIYQWRPFCYMGQDRQKSETGKPPSSTAAACQCLSLPLALASASTSPVKGLAAVQPPF